MENKIIYSKYLQTLFLIEIDMVKECRRYAKKWNGKAYLVFDELTIDYELLKENQELEVFEKELRKAYTIYNNKKAVKNNDIFNTLREFTYIKHIEHPAIND